MTGTAEHSALQAWPRIYGGAGNLPAQPGLAGRAQSDAYAAWLRWSDPATAECFSPAERPWYELLEQARVQTLAAQHLPGMRDNLGQIDCLAPTEPLTAHVYRCARAVMAGEVLSAERWCVPRRSAGRSLLLTWWFERVHMPPLNALLRTCLLDAQVQLNDGPLFAEAMRPLIEACAKFFGGIAPDITLRQRLVAGDGPSQGAVQAAPSLVSTEAEVEPYRVFSRAWDELLGSRELTRLVHEEQLLLPAQSQASAQRLARQLRRRLQALRVPLWRFDQEQGALDSRRLASLVASGNRAVFRQESQARAADACVTLLLDQSGSMRGLPRQMTLLAVDLAVQALESAGIRCEVLGYCTRYGQENPVQEAWVAAGRPSQPGRLNALRHVIYKASRQPWRNCRTLLAREGVSGGENIDGEALSWAAQRLAQQPQARKILLVLCDGQPHDQATASANGRDYLEADLHRRIAAVERSTIHLVAIGMGQGLGRYYRNSLTLSAPEEVFRILFEHLAVLLDAPCVEIEK